MTERQDVEKHSATLLSSEKAGGLVLGEKLELLLLVAGIFALFLPTYFDLAKGPWTDPHESHGPFILAIAVGTAFARRNQFCAAQGGNISLGIPLMLVGLLFYVIGRSQEFLVFETFAQLPVMAGAILCLKGRQGLRAFWFPLVFLIFTVAWPGWLIDALTLPLKQMATNFTVDTLFDLGYPISSTGVIIMVGRYQLLVADACSGLNTIISLLSVGVLYLYMTRRPGVAWNLAILIAMPFIALFANILRVAALTLITYHFGQAAGESFIHDFTGLFLFGVALASVFALDSGIEHGAKLMHWVRQNKTGDN